MDSSDYMKHMGRIIHGTGFVPQEPDPARAVVPRRSSDKAKVNFTCGKCNTAVSLTLEQARAERAECPFCHEEFPQEQVASGKITQPFDGYKFQGNVKRVK